eukprot:scaffold3406_cov177-Amphora_coffeaeformis.AAC.2
MAPLQGAQHECNRMRRIPGGGPSSNKPPRSRCSLRRWLADTAQSGALEGRLPPSLAQHVQKVRVEAKQASQQQTTTTTTTTII